MHFYTTFILSFNQLIGDINALTPEQTALTICLLLLTSLFILLFETFYIMSFDAQSFLDATVHTANDTKIIPVPVGEYFGIIDKIAARQWQSKDGTKSGLALDVTWLVEDAGVKSLLGRDTVTVRQGIMLDITSQGGLDLSLGKNIDLGRLREAVGKNQEGEPFSFSMLPGLTAKIRVTHRIDGENTYSEVKGVAKL
jgi:hypothetical protein